MQYNLNNGNTYETIYPKYLLKVIQNRRGTFGLVLHNDELIKNITRGDRRKEKAKKNENDIRA